MAWTQKTIDETYVKVQKLAAEDEEFRNELLADPMKAIRALTGEQIPEEIKIKVIESDPNYTATFLIPPMVSDELQDGDLEGVAGGACIANMENTACAANATAELTIGKIN